MIEYHVSLGMSIEQASRGMVVCAGMHRQTVYCDFNGVPLRANWSLYPPERSTPLEIIHQYHKACQPGEKPMRELKVSGSPSIWDCADAMTTMATRERQTVWMEFNGLRLEAVYSPDPQQRTTANQIVGKYREFLDAQAEQAKEKVDPEPETMSELVWSKTLPGEPGLWLRRSSGKWLAVMALTDGFKPENFGGDYEWAGPIHIAEPKEPTASEPQHTLLLLLGDMIPEDDKHCPPIRIVSAISEAEKLISELTAAQDRIHRCLEYCSSMTRRGGGTRLSQIVGILEGAKDG